MKMARPMTPASAMPCPPRAPFLVCFRPTNPKMVPSKPMIWNNQKHGTIPTRLHTRDAMAMPELPCFIGIAAPAGYG